MGVSMVKQSAAVGFDIFFFVTTFLPLLIISLILGVLLSLLIRQHSRTGLS
jgi:hypothetical protein